MNEESVITILESLYNNTSITFLGLLMPTALNILGSAMETEFKRINSKIEQIKAKISSVREECNKDAVTVKLFGVHTFP